MRSLSLLILIAATALAQNGCGRIDLVLILDSSGSVEQEFESAKDLAIDLVNALAVSNEQTRVGLITYAGPSETQRVHELNGQQEKAAVTQLLKDQPWRGGWTEVGEAMTAAESMIKEQGRADAEKLVLIVSDGHSQTSWKELKAIARRFNDSNIPVHATTKSSNANALELTVYTAGRRDRVYIQGDVSTLRNYLLSISGRCQPQHVEPALCAGEADLVVILDSSGSVENEFQRERDLLRDVVAGLPIAQGQVHLGVVTYHDQSYKKHQLSDAQDTNAAISLVESLPHLGGATNVAAAFEHTLEIFRQGGRPGVKKVVLIVSDGHSQNTWQDLRRLAKNLKEAGIDVYASTESPSPSHDELQLYAGEKARVFVGRDQAIAVQRIILDAVNAKACDKPAPVVQPQVDCDAADFVFVLDSSGSVTQHFYAQVDFIARFVRGLNVASNRVAVVEYSGLKREVPIGWGEKQGSITELEEAVRALEHYKGTTKTGLALDVARERVLLDRNHSKKTVVVVVTDGFSQDDVKPPASAIRQLPNVDVYAVAVEGLYNVLELEEITADKSKVFHGANAFSEFAAALAPYSSC